MDSYHKGLNLNIKNMNEISIECLNNDFIRGIFDKYGNLNKKNLLDLNLFCYIEFTFDINENLFCFIKTFGNFTNEIYNDRVIYYKDNNAFDFLSSIYDDCDIRFKNNDKYNSYLTWVKNYYLKIPKCIVLKASKDAIIPSKNRASDIGYDLTILKKIKDINSKIFLYDTLLIIKPEFGYYIKFFNTDLLLEKGYKLLNTEFIQSNDETLKIYLLKIDMCFPELVLPFTGIRIILEKYIHFTIKNI